MRISVLSLVGLLALSCSGVDDTSLTNAEESEGLEFAQLDSAIIRATANGGRNEAVMLYIYYDAGEGNFGTRTCSGSYFAPRVVLTAAHCFENAYLNGVFVYYGDNFAADLPAVDTGFGLDVPPPGQPSTFAAADSWELNPAWNPSLVSADMAVAYLDRKLPFDPLPLARFNIDASFTNKETTFSGWGANTVTGPISATGAQVQRTGKTRFLGSPTAADYHADDPNPGMLNANVRRTVLKTDGRAPYANGCFGDSGNPLFVSQWGQTYIAGVGYWTGLYCADYNLYTRIDPYLPFLDQAYKKGGQEVLKPTFQCVAPAGSGKYIAYFGYDNKNGVGVSVPYGNKNKLQLDAQNRRPNLFAPGVHTFQFGVQFTTNQTVSYTLSPDNSPTTTLNVTKNSTACNATQATQVTCGAACNATFNSGCSTVGTFGSCVEDCVSTIDAFNAEFQPCADEITAWYACNGTTPPGAANWTCDPEYGPQTRACDDESLAIDLCFAELFGG